MLAAHVSLPLVTNQIEVSVLRKEPLHDGTLDYCLQKKIAPMAWSPLGGGQLFTATTAREIATRKALTNVAREHQNANIEQVELAWLLAHPAKIVPVIGSNKTIRILESARSESIQLTREQWFEIWSASAQCDVP